MDLRDGSRPEASSSVQGSHSDPLILDLIEMDRGVGVVTSRRSLAADRSHDGMEATAWSLWAMTRLTRASSTVCRANPTLPPRCATLRRKRRAIQGDDPARRSLRRAESARFALTWPKPLLHPARYFKQR
jgi:hypothetical protein